LGKKLYVSNLDYSIGKSDLEQMFADHGTVAAVQLITDRNSGRSKGFAFVEMAADSAAQAAIAGLNGKEVAGRSLSVSEARSQEPRSASTNADKLP
jgi:RNA recognition motif-containing protein